MARAPDIDLDPYLPLMGVLSDREVAKRARVGVSAVAAFRRDHGIADKAPAPDTPTGKRSKLAPFHDLMGHLPDAEIATMAGASVTGVYGYRRRHGIPLDPEVAKRPNLRPPRKHQPAPSQEDDDGIEALRPLHDRIGKSPDYKIAELAGVGTLTVAHYRERHGIPAYTPPLGGRKSKLEPYFDLLGVVPDDEIATMAGVTAERVRKYRFQHGIPAAWPRAEEAQEDRPSPDTIDGADATATPETRRSSKKRKGSRAAPPRKPPQRRTRRGSKLEPYLDRIGRIPDDEVAAMAGVKTESVRLYRSRHGVDAEWLREPGSTSEEPDSPEPPVPTAQHIEQDAPLAPRESGAPEPTPPPPEAEPPAPPKAARPKQERRARGGPRSKIDPFADKVGKVPDAELARMAGVTPQAARKYRYRRGIARAQAARQDRKQSIAAPPVAEAAMSIEAEPAPSAEVQAYTVEVEGAAAPLYLLATNVLDAWDKIETKMPREERDAVKAIRWLGPGLR